MHIKKRITLMSVVLGILTLGIAGAVGIPSVFAIKNTLAEVKAAQAKLNDRFEMNRRLSRARDDIAAKKKLVAPLSASSILEQQELDFVTAVENAAKAAGVTHRLSLETSAQLEVSVWQREVPVTISASGNYLRVLTFMDILERMKYLYDIRGVSLSSGGEGGPGSATLELRGIAFWIGNGAPAFVTGKEPVAAPATPPAAAQPTAEPTEAEDVPSPTEGLVPATGQ